MSAKDRKRAALLVIGNEILSGRTQDTNTNHIARELTAHGVDLSEVRVVPDIERKIIAAVNALRAEYDYVFTTGGIGPTHDDITAASVAKAFGVALERNEEAYQMLVDYYQAEGEINEARARMALIPQGASLIPNPVSGAPGFVIGNVYVMAGVPKIMQAMFDHVLTGLEKGAAVLSVSVAVSLVESAVAQDLGDLQADFEDVEIGSYPNFRDGRPGLSIVLRSVDAGRLDLAMRELVRIVENLGGRYDIIGEKAV